MTLTPNLIYENLRKKEIDKQSAIYLLISLIENVDDIETRLESIETIEKINLRSDEVFEFLENLCVSDLDDEIRSSAAITMKNMFLEKAIQPLKWGLEKDNSVKSLIAIVSSLGDINNNKVKSVLIEKIKEIDEIQLNRYLKNLFEHQNIEDLSNKELAEILINYYIVTSLKMKFGYLEYGQNRQGGIVKLDLSNVGKLGFGSTGLTPFFTSIFSLPHLKMLNLKLNNLTRIPEKLKKSDSLEYLDLSYNRLRKIPKFIGTIPSLKKLILKSNRLKFLPENLSSLTSLETLNLRYNRLTTLPQSIGSLSALKKLDLHGNKLSDLPISFGSLKSLKDLKLGWNNFREFPLSLKSLTSLEILGFGGNKLITRIPKWINNLSSLKEFYFYDNNLKRLPDSIGSISSLKVLILRNNRLSTLPSSMTSLSSLKVLNLSWNIIKVLPDWISSLKSLEELNLWGNRIDTLPKSIECLNSLKILNLKFTNIKNIPEWLKSMTEKGLIIKI